MDTTPPDQPAHTRIIGRYYASGILGHGAMGTVYRGQDPLIGRTVALKVLSPELLAPPAPGGDFRKEFFREARAAGQLNHPNIVTIYDVGEHDGLPYIAMEFLPGLTLREYLDSGVVFTLRRCVEIGILLARGLDYAHQNNVVHRDIKPANIMLGRKGTVKIMDFGIAVAPHAAGKAHTDARAGSPRYMAPEQLSGAPTNAAVDIFALGVTLYETLTGKNPFDAPTFRETAERILKLTPPPPSSLNPDVPPQLDAIVMHALGKDPARRFPRIKDLGHALVAVRGVIKKAELAAENGPAPTAGGDSAFDAALESGDRSLDRLELAGAGSRLRDEIREHLQKLDITRDLDADEHDLLGMLLRLYLLPDATELFREGDEAGYLGLLLEGRMSVTRQGKPGAPPQLLDTLEPGMVFGEMALLDPAPRSATLRADTPCQIAVLSRRHFRKLCREQPALAVKLLLGLGGVLSQRLRRASDKLAGRL